MLLNTELLRINLLIVSFHLRIPPGSLGLFSFQLKALNNYFMALSYRKGKKYTFFLYKKTLTTMIWYHHTICIHHPVTSFLPLLAPWPKSAAKMLFHTNPPAFPNTPRTLGSSWLHGFGTGFITTDLLPKASY